MGVMNGLRRLVRSLGCGLVVVLLAGSLAAATHHHADGREDAGCAVCTLAHSPADAAQVAVSATVSMVPVRLVVVTRTHRPSTAPRLSFPSRAPPQG